MTENKVLNESIPLGGVTLYRYVLVCQGKHTTFNVFFSAQQNIQVGLTTALVGPNSHVYPPDSVSTNAIGPATLQSQLLVILSRQIIEQDPQHGMTPKLININTYGMFHNWVLLG